MRLRTGCVFDRPRPSRRNGDLALKAELKNVLLAHSDDALVAAYAALLSSDLQRAIRDVADRLQPLSKPADCSNALFLTERVTGLLELAELLEHGALSDLLRRSASAGVDVGAGAPLLSPAIRTELLYIQATASVGWNRALAPDLRQAFSIIGQSASVLLGRRSSTSVVRAADLCVDHQNKQGA